MSLAWKAAGLRVLGDANGPQSHHVRGENALRGYLLLPGDTEHRQRTLVYFHPVQEKILMGPVFGSIRNVKPLSEFGSGVLYLLCLLSCSGMISRKILTTKRPVYLSSGQ